MTRTIQNYVDGGWVDASPGASIPVHDPATGQLLAHCPDSTAADVDMAVRAARAAFDEWRSTPVLVRAQFMHHFKVMVEERFEDIAQ
ncbi:MAG: aldehyde dehydrogenase family protein, partial [Chloroflexi bacterium]|nr:aldehyde dehydrogenase family protein [Chloroflexota bacterium]